MPKAYNSFAGEFSSTRHYQWKEFDRLSKTLPKTGLIADIGCGNARLSHFIQKAHFTGSYIGIDISEGLLETAKKNTEELQNITLQTGNFLELNLEKNSCTQIWAVASFHHLPTHQSRIQALENIHTALDTNGELILTVWNLWDQKKYIPEKKSAFWKSMCNPFWGKRDFIITWGKQKTPRYYYSFSKEYLEQILEQTGFSIEDSFYSQGEKNLCIRAKKREEKRFILHSIPFDIINLDDAWKKIQATQTSNHQNVLYTPNPEMIVEASKNQNFKIALQNADISVADGNGILWASGLGNLTDKWGIWKWTIGIFRLMQFGFAKKSYPKVFPSVICGSDMFRKYVDQNTTQHIPTFLLGGSQGSAKYIADNFDGITGYFDGMVNKENTEKIIDQINVSGATTLFVALGAPKQEIWIYENKAKLINIKLIAGVGGSFDFISGHQKRAPKIFQSLGLEWLYRVFREPSRAKRIWNATGVFIQLIMKN